MGTISVSLRASCRWTLSIQLCGWVKLCHIKSTATQVFANAPLTRGTDEDRTCETKFDRRILEAFVNASKFLCLRCICTSTTESHYERNSVWSEDDVRQLVSLITRA